MAAIVFVMGTRPNYVKVAPLWRAASAGLPAVRRILVDTGQHYDDALSRTLARDLELPEPDWTLGVGSASDAEQMARVMVGFEDVCRRERPDLVLVVGDVNSTVASALVAAKQGIPVAHVEAGLRSFDRSMPEEVNRIVTDQLADLLFAPSTDAVDNLRREGIPAERVYLVGNVMIDSLLRHLPAARLDRVRARFPIEERGYAVLTLHRPVNVDRPEPLRAILEAVRKIAAELPVVFPVHPRTRRRLAEFGLAAGLDGLLACDAVGYLDFLSLTAHARLVLTDSGGLQEEAAFLGVPCLILRTSTERPVTLAGGASRLVGSDPGAILAGFEAALAGPPIPCRPDLWDGQAATRVVAVLGRALAA
jgi:UDP-N-acetylglucosamine 2-epimerase (non-hydrolysing)